MQGSEISLDDMEVVKGKSQKGLLGPVSAIKALVEEVARLHRAIERQAELLLE